MWRRPLKERWVEGGTARRCGNWVRSLWRHAARAPCSEESCPPYPAPPPGWLATCSSIPLNCPSHGARTAEMGGSGQQLHSPQPCGICGQASAGEPSNVSPPRPRPPRDARGGWSPEGQRAAPGQEP
eukprot:gene18162-biopygen11442